MTQTVDLNEIKQKLIEKLKPSGWATKLKSFVYSSEFDKILETLYQEREDGKRFTPPLKQVFRAFEECPVDKLKIVMIGQDPYPFMGIADGLAFSCSNTMKPQPSLQQIFGALDLTVYNGEFPEHNPDLTRWANQGILLLNSSLTVQIDKIGSHYHIWNEFIMYVMDMLNLTNTGLIFILLGKKAEELEQVIGPNHYILKATHPASAAYSKTQWDCKNIFNEANRIITEMNGPEQQIIW